MSFFSSLDQVSIDEAPFPHLVVEDALDADVCEALIREIPPLPVLTQNGSLGSNKRYSLSYKEARRASEVSETWKSVLEEAMSQEFLDRLLGLFGVSILRAYPDFEAKFGKLNSLVAMPRQEPGRPDNAIGMDAQIAVNTPVLSPGTSVRGPHLDRIDKLFIGLLYLRVEEDQSKGGNLELYRPLKKPEVYLPKRMLPWDQVTAKKTVPYRRNTLVLFMNSPEALHGVSPRTVTDVPRYFINLVGETSAPLFEVKCQGDEEEGDDDWFTPGAPQPDTHAGIPLRGSSGETGKERGLWGRIRKRIST